MEYQTKLNEKYMSVLSSIVAILHFKFFEDISYEKLTKYTSSFVCCCFIPAFTPADIIFYNFLELHSKLSQKRFLSQIFH